MYNNIGVIKKYNNFYKYIYYIISIIIMYYWLYEIIIYNNNNIEYQSRKIINIWNIKILVGLDGINIPLIFIIVIITPILLLIREKYNKEDINYQKLIIILEIILISVLIVLDIFYFYTLFEILLIPLYIILIKYGSRYKKYEASNRIFIYTMLGSLSLLIAIIILNIKYGTTNYEILELELKYENYKINILLWILMFLSFAIKIPIYPFHLWLPEAHTEAPTTGSVLLAAIILKIGVYGFIKFNLSWLHFINIYLSPIIMTLSLLSIAYSSFLILRLIDLKRIIAYSSIIHMNLVMIGIYTYEYHSIIGSYLTTISHAFISSSLFILIGVLYRRYFTRIITYYKGLFNIMPIFGIILMYFILSNISLPTTSSFPGEILFFLGSIKYSMFFTIILLFFLIFSTAYNILILNKVIFGNLSLSILKYKDLSLNEFLSLIPLIFFNFVLGINSTPIIDIIYIHILKIFLL